ncbi:unnamed protein product [Absidia cylindrospora]
MLRKHVNLTPLKKNFVIADEEKSKNMVKAIFKEHKSNLSPQNQKLDSEDFRRWISQEKNKGIDSVAYKSLYENDPKKMDIALIYSAYEEQLKEENMTDFDGLLLHCRDLLKDNSALVDFVEHVLVDEFQDTNALQYDLLTLITGGGEKSITVVGDPDQSIYGWRFADKAHFEKMIQDYEGTVIVDLKESYRSTKHILSGANHVVSKDEKRTPRQLFTNNNQGVPISILKASTDTLEGEMIAKEIKRILELSDGLVKYKDIAIIIRMNFLTSNFAQALSRAEIPFIVITGKRFLDLLEVKDILAYLSFFYNHRDLSSFTHLINIPKRGLGEISIKKIHKLALEKNWTLVETIQNIVDKHPATKGMRIMSKAILELERLLVLQKQVQEKLDKKESISDILQCIVDSIDYSCYLKANYQSDYQVKSANIEELIAFARQQDCEVSENESGMDALGRFLESVTLCGNLKEQEEAQDGKVCLITAHAAKGLEWTCVFVAGCEQGIIPMGRSDNMDEESRVLYVAMTRAKCFLYCTYAAQRKRWYGYQQTVFTNLLCDLPVTDYQKQPPTWNTEVRFWVSQVLRLPYKEDGALLLENHDDEDGDKALLEAVDQITADLQKKLLY